MRITNGMLINNMLGYMEKNVERMEKYQQMLANGKKIMRPSDDPVIAARALKLRTDLAEVEQFKRNVNDSQSWMETTEGALGNMGDVLNRIRELTVQGASGQTVVDDMKKINEEVKQLKQQMITLGNTTYAGRYIFSGYTTDNKLMNEDGSFAISVGTDEKIKYEIGIGDSVNINVHGGDILNGGSAAIGDTSYSLTGDSDITFPLTLDALNNVLTLGVDGETDVDVEITPGIYDNMDSLVLAVQNNINQQIGSKMVNVAIEDDKLKLTSFKKGTGSAVLIGGVSTSLTKLGLESPVITPASSGTKGKMMQDIDELITSLDSGDGKAVGKMLAKLDVDINNLLRVRADIGARLNRVELTSNRLENDTTNFTRLMSENEDVDMAKTIMELQNEENVYKASLAGGAKVIMPTLIDFLR